MLIYTMMQRTTNENAAKLFSTNFWLIRSFTDPTLNRQHFRLLSFAALCFNCPVFWGALDLFRSYVLLIFNLVWPWFFCGTFFVCPQFPYQGNNVMFWIFSYCSLSHILLVTLAIGKDLDLSFFWGHHHLHYRVYGYLPVDPLIIS